MNKQMTLPALTGKFAQAGAKKIEFLEQMDRIWSGWIGIIKPYCYKGGAQQ